MLGCQAIALLSNDQTVKVMSVTKDLSTLKVNRYYHEKSIYRPKIIRVQYLTV